MKQICLFLMLGVFSLTAFGQNKVAKSKRHYYVDINDSSFVAAMPENGATMRGYFRNDTIYRIETWFGFNFGEVTRVYYYWKGELSLVNETQKLYNAKAVSKEQSDSIKVSYTGRYIFKNRTLTDISQKGTYSISDTPSSKEETQAALLMLSDKYLGLLYDRRNEKKNRHKIKGDADEQ
ncbi:MAG: hypothetical protein R2794_07190 [Chitinophagales bacterium]